MKNKFSIILFLCAILSSMAYHAFAQQETDKKTTIQSVIVDEAGNPINNANIYSGSSYVKTKADGMFSISIDPGTDLIVEALGYEKVTISANDAQNALKINLKPVAFLYEDNQKVNLAFREAHKGDVVGAISKMDITEARQYDNWLFGNNLTGRTLGVLGNSSIRGIGYGLDIGNITGGGDNNYSSAALVIVDGLPRDNFYFRASEIENVTVLKDVNSAILYGSAAINGVILVTTKRGEAFKKRADVSFNYGISTPKELPNYLNSADFMTYYNLARRNDGMSDLFSEQTIDNYRNGNPYRYPSTDYYSDEYLKPFKSYFDVNAEFSGGNKVAKYYANAGWDSQGGLLGFGYGKNERDNIFNIRTNVDLKINDWIDTDVDGTITFYNFKNPNANYWGNASTLWPHQYAPLLPINLIDPNNPLLVGSKRNIDGQYLVGGNANTLTTPIGDVYLGGEYESLFRRLSFNNKINFDFGQWVNGLSFHTNFSFDYISGFTQTVANTYSVYEATWAPDKDIITGLTQRGVDAHSGNMVVGGTFLQRRIGFYGLLSYDRTFEDIHHFTGSLLGYGSLFKESGEYQGIKQSHLGLQLAYVYNKKYMVDFSSAYVNSVRLAPGSRGGFSPSVGLAWVISSEEFMSAINSIDYLKLRVSAGNLKSDFPLSGFFWYDDRTAGSGTFYWNETKSRGGIVSSWASNSNLGYTSRKDFNIGLESWFFKKLLGFEANYFYSLYDGLVVRANSEYPNFFQDHFTPYDNYNANQYQGFELGVNLNKTVGYWSFFAGINLLYSVSERTKVSEIYANEYRYRQGRPVDASFGLEAVGFFESKEDIDNSPRQVYSTLQPGDIKYKDQNGDNLINADDEVYIRRQQAPLSGGLQIKVSYKNWTLYALGEGRTGANGAYSGDYYWVDGIKKYSDVVLNSWVAETKDVATYPRLSTQTNLNNNQNSTFWLYNNDYFSIRKIQLSYQMPQSISKVLFMKDLYFFINTTDPYQFAKNRKVLDLRTGNEPYYRTYSIGIRAIF